MFPIDRWLDHAVDVWRDYALGAMAFLVAIAFMPGVPEGAEVLRWGILSVGIVALFLSLRIRPTPAHTIGAILLVWAWLSMLWTPVLPDGADALWKLLLLAGAFCIGSEATTLRPFYLGLAAGMSVSGALAVAQLLGFHGIAQVAVPAGLFGNRNMMAEAGAVALIGVLPLALARRWSVVLLAGPLLAAALPLSRGALAGLAAAAFVAIWRRSRAAALAILLIASLGIGASVVTEASRGSHSTSDRSQIWGDTLDGMTPLGNGIGSFLPLYPRTATRHDSLHDRPEYAHNEYLHYAFELGPAALLLATVLLLAWLAAAETERLILTAIAVEALFAFPLHMPVTALVAAVVAGHACGARHRLRQFLARRKSALCPGLALGPAHRHRPY